VARIRFDLGSNSLPPITAQISEAYGNMKRAALDVAENYIRIGRLLTEAKGIIGFGRFGDYIRNNFKFSGRTAQYYMRVAASGMKSATVAELGLRLASERLDWHLIKKDNPDLIQKTGVQRRVESRRAEKRHRERYGRPLPEKPTTHNRFGAYEAPGKLRPGWVEIQRPSDAQVLRVEWETGEYSKTVVYLWRALGKIVGDYEGSSLAFRYIKYTTFDIRDRPVTGTIEHSGPRFLIWGDARSALTTHDDKLGSISDALPDTARQEVWNADETQIQVLDEWHTLIQINETQIIAARHQMPDAEIEPEPDHI
jgi:Protein of unknown function (DUF3102)